MPWFLFFYHLYFSLPRARHVLLVFTKFIPRRFRYFLFRISRRRGGLPASPLRSPGSLCPPFRRVLARAYYGAVWSRSLGGPPPRGFIPVQRPYRLGTRLAVALRAKSYFSALRNYLGCGISRADAAFWLVLSARGGGGGHEHKSGRFLKSKPPLKNMGQNYCTTSP